MNSFGKAFRITLYGESHQSAIGIVIDGMPPGVVISKEAIAEDLKRRNPDKVGTTPRKEKDNFTITSGLLNDTSTGSPLHITIPNQDVKSKDYDHLKRHPRPGHSDFVAQKKYHAYNDHRGGGRFSGRLTAPIVVAGSVAKMFLPFTFQTDLVQVGTLKDMSKIDEYLETIKQEGDSVGGIIETVVTDLPIGLGEPMFHKVESLISQMLFSIPAVKGVEFGIGFKGIEKKGSQLNDRIEDESGRTLHNHSGGTSGGITNGNPLVVKVFIKPTSSIQKNQETYDFSTKSKQNLQAKGRHDVCIARRAPIVVENAVAIVLADLYLEHLKNEAFQKTK